MTYFRLCDIKTPPFAYVLNKSAAVRVCDQCDMPFRQLEVALQVEICTADPLPPLKRIQGRPMMADFWLIGDATCRERLESLFPDELEALPIRLLSLYRGHQTALQPEPLVETDAEPPTTFFYFRPIHQLQGLSPSPQAFDDAACMACGREMTPLPFGELTLQTTEERPPSIAAIRDHHLEGYDYLFHERSLETLQQMFPEMILERLHDRQQVP